MADKKLIIFPGAGNPKTAYRKVYDLLKNEATNRGYIETAILLWPGHILNDSSNKSLDLTTSIEKAIKSVKRISEDRISYDIIARSYGCHVIMKMLDEYQPRYLKNIILWGPSPFYSIYHDIKDNFSTTQKSGLDKGVNIGKDFLNHYLPFEYLVYRYKKNFFVRISSGELDKSCSPQYLKFLDSIKGENISIVPPIKGLPHEIDVPDLNYFQFLFS